MMKNYGKQKMLKSLFRQCLFILGICIMSCSNGADINEFIGIQKSRAYDPSKPVNVTDFIPKSGGSGQKLVIYGDNFGNVTSAVKVYIGDKTATIINVKNNALYCFVPSKAYTGTITINVGKDSLEAQRVTADSIFHYQKKMVVGTLCGHRNQNDDQGWHDGSFDDCVGFRNDGCLVFDPIYHNRLYVVYDGGIGIQELDMNTRQLKSIISTSPFGTNRLRSIDFTLDGKYMIISTDRGDQGRRSPSVWLLKRNVDGTFNNSSSIQLLASYRDCNGASIHPVNGELYFNSFERSQVFRLDMQKYFDVIDNGKIWAPAYDDGAFKEIFTIQDVGWEFKIFIHPTGKYAYIVVANQHYILRSDYNEQTKCFAPPYVVVGTARNAGWADGVGTTVRLNRPYQGVFVRNSNYVKEGRDDDYDFYFCDCQNQCIRKLTPDGVVTTFAGRGAQGHASDTNWWGTEDGDLRQVARFRDPTGITYDENTHTFYILDVTGRKIRTIAMEK